MKDLIPAHQEFVIRAIHIPGLKIVYGTDAVAGAQGRNAEDFINRVRDCGVDPVSYTHLDVYKRQAKYGTLSCILK